MKQTKIKTAYTLFLLLFIASFVNAQEDEKYRIITGIRVNPLVIYDLEGNRKEFVRIHGEVGALIDKRTYFSVGYTPFTNSIYSFNEFWFIPLDRPLPISAVISAEYMFDDEKLILQGGPNFKFNGGNGFLFLFTPADEIDWGLKVGVFIPINIIISKG
jgi:hypothetical protein